MTKKIKAGRELDFLICIVPFAPTTTARLMFGAAFRADPMPIAGLCKTAHSDRRPKSMEATAAEM